MRRHVYLVPGFFGFTALGDLNYFQGVEDALAKALDARDVETKVVSCRTKPTASIRRRAEALTEEVVATGGLDADELHFVGHSTGGLDVRLLLSPGVQLRDDDVEQQIGERTKSCVTLSTPHFGTPLAGFFTTLPGRHALRALSLLAISAPGRYAIASASTALRAIARWDDRIGRKNTLLDALSERALARLSVDADDPYWEFFREVASDQGAVIQLTPEAANLFNAAVVDRPDTRYGSVVSVAPVPGREYALEALKNPSHAALRASFAALWLLTSREHHHYPYPHPGQNALSDRAGDVGFPITRRSNDGIVPALSQVHGSVIGIALADHLDVVGQYNDGKRRNNWLPSGSEFDGQRFHDVWGWIADYITGAAESESDRAAS